MLELWLLRHGATAWARDGRHTGRTDIPLLPEGEEQARCVGPLLHQLGDGGGHPFAAVLASPLQRAWRTAELAGLGAQAQPCDDLLEWNYGAYEGITTAQIRQQVPDWTVWSHGCPQGEDAAAVEARCQRVIQQAEQLAAQSTSPRVALVAHGHVLRSLAGTWLGLGATGGALLMLNTATLSVLGHERQQRAIRHWNVPARR
jgi:broad specificity phosphatase PhoE